MSKHISSSIAKTPRKTHAGTFQETQNALSSNVDGVVKVVLTIGFAIVSVLYACKKTGRDINISGPGFRINTSKH